MSPSQDAGTHAQRKTVWKRFVNANVSPSAVLVDELFNALLSKVRCEEVSSIRKLEHAAHNRKTPRANIKSPHAKLEDKVVNKDT